MIAKQCNNLSKHPYHEWREKSFHGTGPNEVRWCAGIEVRKE